MTTVEIALDIDIDHPAIGAVSVFSKQAGFLDRQKVQEAFEASGIHKALIPPDPGPTVALKRAMTDVAKEIERTSDRSYRIESKGRFSAAVYSIIAVDKQRLDLEEDDRQGVGIADTMISAKAMGDGNGGVKLVITPSDTPFASLIHERFAYHDCNYKCAEDLSQYLSTYVFRSRHIHAVSRAGAGGMYFVPKGESMDTVLKIKEVFDSLSEFSGSKLLNGVKMYVTPMLTTFPDVVDALTDSVLDDAETYCNTLEHDLKQNNSGEKDLGTRALGTKAKEARALADKIEAFKTVCGDAFTDVSSRLNALQVRISVAESVVALDGK